MFCHAYSLWNDARLVVLMFEVLAILQDTKDTEAHSGCWMHRKTSIDLIASDVDAFTKGCFSGFWRETGFRVRMLVLREATVSIRMSQGEAGPRRVTVEGPRVVGNNGRSKREVKCCHKCSKVSVFEASKPSLAEMRCDDMVGVDLNALEIGAVLLLERNHEIQIGIDSCAPVTVFAHFCLFVTKSCKSCVDLSARKVKDKLRGVSFWYANPRMAETCDVLVAMSHASVCVPRGMWNETGAGVKRSL